MNLDNYEMQEHLFEEPKQEVEHTYLKQPWSWISEETKPTPQDEKPLEYDSHGRLMTVVKPKNNSVL